MEIQQRNRPGISDWGIYHRERECAREIGDPCLGIVRARTKSLAEAKAWRKGIVGPHRPLGASLAGSHKPADLTLF